MDFFGIGTPELILILLIFFIFFGPSKLPEIARTIGKVMREFKKASAEMNRNLQDMSEEIKNETDEKADGNHSGKGSLARDLKEVVEDLNSTTREVDAAAATPSGMAKDVGGSSDPKNDSPLPSCKDRGERVSVT